MACLSRRCTFKSFFLALGFFWFLFLTFLLKWYGDNNRESVNMKLKSATNKLKITGFDEIPPSFDDFEDNFAEMPERTTKEQNRILKEPQQSPMHYRAPQFPQEILELQRQLNLTNPGHMGKPVILPSRLPLDIQVQINRSYEIYSINEFLSNVIPYDRELPDIRPDYCRKVKYSDNLPVTSVIMVFHNEPFSMIMRSVFAVLNRTPETLLGEIVLVDDCSERSSLQALYNIT